jgi:hypothetical protein
MQAGTTAESAIRLKIVYVNFEYSKIVYVNFEEHKGAGGGRGEIVNIQIKFYIVT